MRYKLAEDAKPQLALLLLATVVTVILWFIPYAEYLVYPIRLFVTFIHEAGHALVGFVTGGSVQSLTISPDGSGVVYSASHGFISELLTGSAGYLGTTVFGVLLLLLIRRNVSPQKVLLFTGGFIGLITLFFGVLAPLFNIFSLQVSIGTVLFTIVSGALLAFGLVVLAAYSNVRVASFAVAFLAVQCLMNALSDLKTLFFINASYGGSEIQNDAGNMAHATGLPGLVWVFIWMGISILMISLGLRLYAVAKNRGAQNDLPFED
jgi:hypothetical protein